MNKTKPGVTSDKELTELTDFIVKKAGLAVTDPDWRAWLEKVGTYRDEYCTTVKWGKPPEGMMCQVKEELE